jgi:transposase
VYLAPDRRALCIKRRPLLTAAQTTKVDILKGSSLDFAAMRHSAMRSRGLLRGGRRAKLKRWLDDARHSGIYAMQRFARRVRQDIGAVTKP